MDEIEKMQEEVRKLERRVERKSKLLTIVIVLWLVNVILSFHTKLDVWATMYHQNEQISLIDQILAGHEEIDTQLEDFLTWLKENGGKSEK